ncbi:hypothetical protein L9F63_011303, partial [Diploptera punctata]
LSKIEQCIIVLANECFVLYGNYDIFKKQMYRFIKKGYFTNLLRKIVSNFKLLYPLAINEFYDNDFLIQATMYDNLKYKRNGR